jgi:hypothetical protein
MVVGLADQPGPIRAKKMSVGPTAACGAASVKDPLGDEVPPTAPCAARGPRQRAQGRRSSGGGPKPGRGRSETWSRSNGLQASDLRRCGAIRLGPVVTARVAVEQAAKLGWERFVGVTGAIVGMDTFGVSVPPKALATKFGLPRVGDSCRQGADGCPLPRPITPPYRVQL